MTLWKCPGQDRRDFKPEDVILAPCPACGAEIEFFPDDIMVRCSACGKLARNPKFNPACAAWCAYADKCLGAVAAVYRRQPEVLREKLVGAVNRILADFPAARRRALAAATYAAELARREGGAPLVVTAAVLFQNIGLAGPEAAGMGLEADAREVMASVGLPPEAIEAAVAVLGVLAGGPGTGQLEERLARDALRLADWPRETEGKSPLEVEALAASFETAAGREMARAKAGRGRG
ncbi:hypothetical protein EDD75_1908 [Thermodesulfitimonas autotrophica]|uniref:Phosphohydrolase n=1 Tax=Thermodesulfitimonas autotrophica TaxID=1894989 RepID=A0A3N5B033_9THEO|nr:hypothetical protein [Thermodesulfitimonas autotrophica]RPF42798.1 hypothetical protein EDD75_1908 [Thermodesulfitimonas autotrophica]